jgi:hypothetical protein
LFSPDLPDPYPNAVNITVHSGFQETFERTADDLLAGVIAGLASTGVKKIMVTGHSLGASLLPNKVCLIHRSCLQAERWHP